MGTTRTIGFTNGNLAELLPWKQYWSWNNGLVRTLFDIFALLSQASYRFSFFEPHGRRSLLTGG